MTSAVCSIRIYTVLLRNLPGISLCEAAWAESTERRFNLTSAGCRGSKSFHTFKLAGAPGLSDPYSSFSLTHLHYLLASEGIGPSTEKLPT